jgi:spermidine export protein MdtI
MQQFEWVHAAWLGFAIVLEIFANVLLKFSDGFRRKVYGLMSIAAVLGRSAPCRRRSKVSIFRWPMRCGAVLVSPPPLPQVGYCSASG